MNCEHCGVALPKIAFACPVCGAPTGTRPIDIPQETLVGVITEAQDQFERGDVANAWRTCEILHPHAYLMPSLISAPLRVLYGKCLAARGELERALEILEKVQPGRECGNGNASVLFDKHRKLADLYRRLGDRKAQLLNLEKAAERLHLLLEDVGVPEFLLDRGETYVGLFGDTPDPSHLGFAIRSFIDILSRFRSHDVASRALDRLKDLGARGHAQSILKRTPPDLLPSLARELAVAPEVEAEGFLGSLLSLPFDPEVVEKLKTWGTPAQWESGRRALKALPAGPGRRRLAALFYFRGDDAYREEVEASLDQGCDHDATSCRDCSAFLSACAAELLRRNADPALWRHVAHVARAHYLEDLRINCLAVLGKARKQAEVPWDEWVSLLRELVECGNGRLRKDAAARLHATQDPSAKRVFVGLLRDVDPAVQNEAVQAVKNLGVVEAVPELIALLSSPRVAIVKETIAALRVLGGVKAIPTLARLAEPGVTKDKWVRNAAAEALIVLENLSRDPMTIHAEALEDGLVLVTLKGALDTRSYLELNQAMSGLLQTGSCKVIVDLAGIDLVDGLGLGSLVDALSAARERGGDVVITRPTPNVREVFALMGLSALFSVADSVNEAIEALGGKRRATR